MPYTSIQKATFERLISPRICMRYTDEVIYVQKNEMEKDFLKLQEAHEGQQALLQKLQVSGICYNK